MFERLTDDYNPIGVQFGWIKKNFVLFNQGDYKQALLITIKTNDGRIINMQMSVYRSLRKQIWHLGRK